MEKTQILPLNCPDSLELDILHLGFKVISSMTILGYLVSNNQNMSEINFNNVVGRIRSQIQLWSKFRLSLPGRITIAKTFLLSQIGYFSSIIQFNTNMISMLRSEIGIYIKSNLKISIDKVSKIYPMEGSA